MAGMYEKDLLIKKQEVGDSIFNIDSSKTPITRLIKTAKKPKQELSEWTVETYPDDGYQGTMDGKDRAGAGDYDKTAREKVQAYAQLQESPGWLVSTKANATETVENDAKEKAYQARKDGERHALQIEKAILSDMDTRTEGGGLPSRIRGAFSWLQSGAQANLPTPAMFRPAAAAVFTDALSGFTATAFEAMLAAMEDQINQSVNLTMPCGSALKRLMSLWLERDVSADATNKVIASYNMSKTDKRLLQVCNRFEFDSGIVTNMTSHHLLTDANGAKTDYSTRSALLMDLSMWDKGYLIPPTHRSFPDLGGGPRGDHLTYFILRCRNARGQGMIKTNS